MYPICQFFITETMEYKKALKIIKDSEKDLDKSKITKRDGFMVHFEKRGSGVLASDYFPEKRNGEKLISSIDEAWELARRFSNAVDESYVNIYVIDSGYKPIANYRAKKIRPYPQY